MLALAVTALVTSQVYRRLPAGRKRFWLVTLVAVLGYLVIRSLFGEAINPVGWVGLLVGLLGILCLGLPESLLRQWWLMGPEVLGESAWSHGELWMLAAALAMALGTVLSRYACRHSHPAAVTGWHMLIGGVPLLLLQALAPGRPLWPEWTWPEWGLMAYASLLGSALAYGLFFWFATRRDLTGFSTLGFLTPVFALLSGGIWLQERLTALQWVGVCLVLLSVVLVSQRRRFWEPSMAETLPRFTIAPSSRMISRPYFAQ